MDARGFDAESWRTLATFAGRVATPKDVDEGAAVFALADTEDASVLNLSLPQPVIWYEEDEEFCAVAVQAERHLADDETLDVLGLVLPLGETKIAFLDDVDEVDATDPVWLSLLDADSAVIDGDDEVDE